MHVRVCVRVCIQQYSGFIHGLYSRITLGGTQATMPDAGDHIMMADWHGTQ